MVHIDNHRSQSTKSTVATRCFPTYVKCFQKMLTPSQRVNIDGDRRSDIRVDYNAAFHVPIEIKKNTHSDLWSAMHDQLIRYYCSDPDTDGFGIYLVFWFGSVPFSPRRRRTVVYRMVLTSCESNFLLRYRRRTRGR